MSSKTGSGMAPNVDGRPGVKKIKVMDAKQDKSCISAARKANERIIAGGAAKDGGHKSVTGSGKADLKADK